MCLTSIHLKIITRLIKTTAHGSTSFWRVLKKSSVDARADDEWPSALAVAVESFMISASLTCADSQPYSEPEKMAPEIQFSLASVLCGSHLALLILGMPCWMRLVRVDSGG